MDVSEDDTIQVRAWIQLGMGNGNRSGLATGVWESVSTSSTPFIFGDGRISILPLCDEIFARAKNFLSGNNQFCVQIAVTAMLSRLQTAEMDMKNSQSGQPFSASSLQN